MACSIEISEEYRDKYGLPKEMPEAEFYAWLANGGLQQLANDNKLSFSGYQIVDNKFKESLGIAKKISDRVKLTVKKLNKMVYGAEEAGSKTGAKSAVETIKELQADARAYLKENKIASSEAIERAIGRIRNEVTYAKFLTTVELQQNKIEYFEKVEVVNELLKKIAKLKKSDKLTASNKAFIRNTSFPSTMEVSDLDTYAALLQEYIDKRGKGESVFGSINKKLTEFIEKENAYINSYKSNIAALKEMIDDLVLEEEYESLIKEGVFEDTDIQSFEDYKEFWNRVNNQLEILDNDEALLEKISEASKGKKVIENIKTTLNQNKKELKEAFTLASTESMVLDFSLLENADLSIFSLKELILLSNIIDDILYEGDFMAYDSFRSKLAQVQRKKNLENVIKRADGTIRRLLDFAFRSSDPVPTIVTKAAFGTVSEAYLETFFLGKWNSMISNIELKHNDALRVFEKLMNDLGSKMFESSVAIETFAFINQVDEGLTQKEEQEQFENDTTVIAKSAQKKYNANIKSVSPTRGIEIELDKAKYELEALARFGVIENLNFTKKGVTFDFVKGVTRQDIQFKLNAKEQVFYNFVIDAFEDIREDFIEGMEVGLGIPFKGVKNYFPRFSDQFLAEEEKITDIKQLLSGFSGVSRTQNRAKKRSMASGDYSVGLREHFSKGLWESLLVAYGQQQLNDVINSIYSNKFGINSLVKDDTLTGVTANVIKKAITNQVRKDLTYGNVSLNDEKIIRKELSRLVTSQFYGYVLKTIPAFLKQYLPAYSANYIVKPATSFIAEKIIRDREFLNKIMSQTTVVSRNFKSLAIQEAKSYPIEYLKGSEKRVARTSRKIPSIGDVLKPIINKARTMAGKEVRTESMLDYGDVKASNMNIIIGAVSLLQAQNPNITIAEVKEKLLKMFSEENAKQEDFFKEAVVAAAEGYQRAMNAPSRISQQSETLNDKGLAQAFYMFASFQMNTHAEFLKYLKRSLNITAEITGEEKKENVDMIKAFIVQQALFSVGSAILTQMTLSALAKGLGDDEKDKLYVAQKTGIQSLTGFLSSIFLGSYGIFANAAAAAAAEFFWDKKKEGYLKEIKESNPEFNPKGTILDPKNRYELNFNIGGALVSSALFVFDQYEEYKKEAAVLYKAGLPWTSAVLYPFLKISALMLGSGTLRDATNALDIMQDKEMKKLTTILGEIQGRYNIQFQFTDSKALDELMYNFKNVKPEDIRKQLVLIKEDEKADLYFVPKQKIDKYKKNAISELYDIDMKYYIKKDTEELDESKKERLYNEIIKTSNFLDSIKNAKIDDAAKKAEAVKQIDAKVNDLTKSDASNTSTGIKKYTLKIVSL